MADLQPKQPWTWKRIARRIRVPLGFVFAAFYLWCARPTWASILVGALIALLGLIIRGLAAGQVKKDRELTTTGPYAYVRNPLYLGSILLGIGFTIASRETWILVFLIVYFVLIYVPVIQGEQSYLRSQFPAYLDYTRRVPSLVPRTLWFKGVSEGFSSELYFRHREYNSLLGAAAIGAVLIAKIFLLPG